MVSLSDVNPFASVGISGIATVLLIFFLAILFIGMIAFGIFFWIKRKKLKHIIPLYKMIGGVPIKIATYKAMDFKIGFAGDKLWYIPKAKKYVACGNIQTAPNEYPHFERDDGEWINFGLGNIDKEMRQAGVKYIHNDMRAQRIAISNLIEQRFKGKKGFWDKYGNFIAQAIFYLIVCVCMVVIFYQLSGILDKISALFDKVVAYENLKCPAVQGVVPAFVGLMFARRKNEFS